ncbi:MAG: deoxyribose-phosphate aldolase [Myxococcales bacterium]
MSDIQNFDQLVEIIAERVSQRLSAPALPVASASQGRSSGACSSSCTSCANGASGSCGARNIVSLGASRVSPVGHTRTSPDIARYIDHTLLKPDATREEIVKLCDEAKKYGFATVCVNSTNVGLAAQLLKGCSTVPIAVVGFPLGAALASAKAYETREAIRCGAKEIDTVINIGALKSHDYKLVFEDIKAVVDAAKPVPVKVILETSQLDQEEKVIACALSKAAGAAFVKTSTGFAGGGATADDVALMRRIVGVDMGVKASGGVRSREDAEKMIAAGADRIGASASVAIVTGKKSTSSY